MSYDRADWRYGGDFPKDLPDEAGSTHIGIFFAWMALHGMAGALHTEDGPEELRRLLNREVMPGYYLRWAMDEKLWEEDFNDEGNAFAKHYYGEHGFYGDLESVCKGMPSVYHLPDTWDSYALLSPLIDMAFRKWKPRTFLDRFRR